MSFFLKDKIKKTFVSLVIMVPIVAVVVYIVEAGGPYFFFYLLMTVYPEFIAPLFDKYVPLPESELKQKIEKLAASVNFPLKKLLVVHGSKRSAHSNAYMYGFWKNKRIVLFDTLLSEELNAKLRESETEEEKKERETKEKKEEEEEKKRKLGMQDEEVVAVLGHELGHWALWHTVINLVLAEVIFYKYLCLVTLLLLLVKFYIRSLQCC
ncbi:unnamed protein product [Gongylonema pulchrum]|uniref:Uncharacterized protein n=1 Tax=Gongylonema pulchrum TaxID=637853 RepID=A0A3P7NIJ7_9BILA|nr:unnamed protein product [Gongylonema pulchrum]